METLNLTKIMNKRFEKIDIINLKYIKPKIRYIYDND